MKEISIYVDGSYNEFKIGKYKIPIVSYGAKFLQDGKDLCAVYGYTNDPKYLAHHNISGEVLASQKSLEALLTLFDEKTLVSDISVTVYHDNKGVAEWALGTWKRNIPLTQNYYDFMDKYRQMVGVKFRKVKAKHKNKKGGYTIHNKYNDEADELANDAAKIFLSDLIELGEIDVHNLPLLEKDLPMLHYF